MNKSEIECHQYKNPPIIEAIIEIRILPNPKKEMDFEELYNSFKTQYPNKELIHFKTANIDLLNEQSNFSKTNVGLKLSSEDQKYVIQLKNDGIVVSVLNIYHNWDDLEKKAKSIWDEYKKHASPKRVIRAAVRYINKINIPESQFKYEKYFKIYPNSSDTQFAGFFMQLQIPQQEGGLAVLNQTTTQPIQVGFTSILLDLDIFDQIDFEHEEELWKRINTLRLQKNKLFESCITDETRELFQ